jgi:DNA-binding protein HU-beta
LSNEEKVVTKQKLIETLASETKMSKRQVETVLMSMVDVVGRTIKKGEKVSITGFGTFDLGKRGNSHSRDADASLPRR